MGICIFGISRNIGPSDIKGSREKPASRLKLRGSRHFTTEGYDAILLYNKDATLFLGITDTSKISGNEYIIYTVHVQTAAPLQGDISICICRRCQAPFVCHHNVAHTFHNSSIYRTLAQYQRRIFIPIVFLCLRIIICAAGNIDFCPAVFTGIHPSPYNDARIQIYRGSSQVRNFIVALCFMTHIDCLKHRL